MAKGLWVYLVVDSENAPGRVYGVFAEEVAAVDYAERTGQRCDVEQRQVHYGQQMPPLGTWVLP